MNEVVKVVATMSDWKQAREELRRANEMVREFDDAERRARAALIEALPKKEGYYNILGCGLVHLCRNGVSGSWDVQYIDAETL